MNSDAFYDDWLHRGLVEPLRHMNHYLYGMHVSVVPTIDAEDRGVHYVDFAGHYSKYGQYSTCKCYSMPRARRTCMASPRPHAPTHTPAPHTPETLTNTYTYFMHMYIRT